MQLVPLKEKGKKTGENDYLKISVNFQKMMKRIKSHKHKFKYIHTHENNYIKILQN